MLNIEGLNQYYGGSHTLRDVSIQAPMGAVTAVLGRNGMGKTTLLKCMMGLLPVRSGKIEFEGRDITKLKPHERAQLGIALVPQGREIFPRLSVEENMLLAMAATGQPARSVPRWVYETFPILEQFVRRRGGDLSGGQQQQLAIARALVTKPRLLILDEPTEGIQPNIIDEIGIVLRRLATERQLAVVLVEQYVAFVREIGHRFYALDRGRVVANGTTAELTDAVVSRHLSV